jgi:outer membrane protein
MDQHAMSKPTILAVAACCVATAAVSGAQSAPLTLPQAVQLSMEHYPAVKAASEKAAAAAEGIGLARTAYLPHVDVLAQVNRATRNNAFGLLLPQAVVPSISGPVLPNHDGTSVWGSAVGMLVTWEAFDFGARGATVAAAEASRKRAEAASDRTRLDVSATAAGAFLTLLAAQELTRAAQAAVDRAKAVESVAGALVGADLRPALDVERARAESALSAGQLVEARKSVALARASLAELTGVPTSALAVQPGSLLNAAPGVDPAAGRLENHPAALEQQAVVREAESREVALSRSWVPRVNLQGAAFARGTGAETSGATAGGTAGLSPEVSNWGVGLTITFPLLDFSGAHARRNAESHREQAEQAQYALVVQDLTTEIEKAKASVAAARDVLETTSIRLEAARSADRQVLARYKAGLCTMVEVADAERLLTQAETDDVLARLNTWRARLSWSYATGDLSAFLQDAGR